jgi:predicted dienelactone hydrolase
MTMHRGFVVLVASLFAPVAIAAGQERTVTLGGREVVVWSPRASQAAKQPVIIFSHGYGGCATQSRFLTEALAEHGYWVFAPNHKDARCARGGAMTKPDGPFRNPEKWSDQTFTDRRDDIRAIVKAIAASPDYAARADMASLGLAGHSLGGYTVVGLGGGWQSWTLPGVKAVLALSPYTDPFLVHNTLQGIVTPVMYQGGTLDFGITPSLHKSHGIYDASPSPKYFVEFSGAGHFAWTNLRADVHQRILDYALPFLDHYLRGVPAAPGLTQTEAGVAQLRFKSELGARD